MLQGSLSEIPNLAFNSTPLSLLLALLATAICIRTSCSSQEHPLPCCTSQPLLASALHWQRMQLTQACTTMSLTPQCHKPLPLLAAAHEGASCSPHRHWPQPTVFLSNTSLKEPGHCACINCSEHTSQQGHATGATPSGQEHTIPRIQARQWHILQQLLPLA